jgi:acetyl esterase/lipase
MLFLYEIRSAAALRCHFSVWYRKGSPWYSLRATALSRRYLCAYNFKKKRMKSFVLLFILFCPVATVGAQTIARLYNGPAPGSETWHYVEGNTRKYGTKVTYNVTNPSLLIFYPELETANNKAIILVPGGNFHLLKIEQEGTAIAMQLVTRGFTVFVLKHRTIPSPSHDPMQDLASNSTDTLMGALQKILPLATADGLTAVRHVRTHANQYRVSPNKIALLGFSAGATLSLLVAQSADEQSSPNFVGSVAPLNLACDELPHHFTSAATDSPIALHIYQDQFLDGRDPLLSESFPTWFVHLTAW